MAVGLAQSFLVLPGTLFDLVATSLVLCLAPGVLYYPPAGLSLVGLSSYTLAGLSKQLSIVVPTVQFASQSFTRVFHQEQHWGQGRRPIVSLSDGPYEPFH